MKLDIITPIYNSDYLFSLLQSITSTKYIQNLNIILVNDGDNRNYSSIINQFKNLNIIYLSYEKNQGPGIARQYGLDNSRAPFITFIDSDDIFLPNGLNTIIETIQKYPDKYLYLFDFIENDVYCSKIDHYGTMGQIYARKFLNKYNIKFPTKQPYYLEDYGFNLASMYILKYYQQENKIYHIINSLTKNVGPANSLTRKNYDEFIYKNWARGSAWNTTYAINFALKNGVSYKFLLDDASKIMSEQYWFYCNTNQFHPQYLTSVLEGCKYYYNNCYKQFQNIFGIDCAIKWWNDNYKLKIDKNFPTNFIQFLNKMENEDDVNN